MTEKRTQTHKIPGAVAAAVLATVLLIFMGFGFYAHSLRQAQMELMQLLASEAGNYNEDRVVLSSTSHAEAREMAEAFGGQLRITKGGTVAVIRLPEGVTLTDIAENDDFRKYHDRIGLDYNNIRFMEETETTESEETLQRPNFEVSADR